MCHLVSATSNRQPLQFLHPFSMVQQDLNPETISVPPQGMLEL
jgi:hypothetical protein